MKNKEHLPVFGIGPVCIYLMLGISVIAIVLHCLGYLDSGLMGNFSGIMSILLGIVLIVLGIYIWCLAFMKSKIAREIRLNHLVTDGVYSWVRNPVYSGMAMAFWGATLICRNWWMLIPGPVFWLIITAVMIPTEEKWLSELYGDEYREYCRRVNRVIPWFPQSI